MLSDQTNIVVCITSMLFGALLFLAAWYNMSEATGGFAKVLGVFLFGGLLLFFTGLFSLFFGNLWFELRNYNG